MGGRWHRREAIRDEAIQTTGVGIRSLRAYQGTHAMGGYAGTISFPARFTGTPAVMLGPVAGSALGQTVPLGVRFRNSGSFSYFGSPRAGTFAWLAVGP